MRVFYGACVVIVEGDDGEAIGWCCRCKEFAKVGQCWLGDAAIDGEDAAGHVFVRVWFDEGSNGGCDALSGKAMGEVLIGHHRHR